MDIIHFWTDKGKQAVLIANCINVTAYRSTFKATSKSGRKGEINLTDFDSILELKPEIIDQKALELKSVRDKLKILFGNR